MVRAFQAYLSRDRLQSGLRSQPGLNSLALVRKAPFAGTRSEL